MRICIPSLILIICATLCIGGRSRADGGEAADHLERADDATEFLRRWDRRYRLVSPEEKRPGREKSVDYSAAASELKKAVVTGIPDGEMYYRLGFCYEKLGDHKSALDCYARAAGSVGEGGGNLSEAISFRRGLTYAAIGRYEEAAREFEGAAESEQFGAPAQNNLGYCYKKLFLRRKALEKFEMALSIDPLLPEAHLNAGVAKAELGDLKGSEASLRRAVELAPMIEGGMYSLGLVLKAGGDPDRAEQAFAEAVTSFPRNDRAHLALAKLYLSSGRRAKAREEAEIARTLSPSAGGEDAGIRELLKNLPGEKRGPEVESIQKLMTTAANCIAKKDFKAAGEAYLAAIERDPRCVPAYLGMAYLSEFAGGERYGKGFPAEKSIFYYKKALEIAPESGSAWRGLGDVCRNAGMYEGAAEAFSRAAELSPDIAKIHYDLGLCYLALGRTEKAKGQFEKVVRLDGRCSEAHFQLARLKTEMRDFAGAIDEYEKVLAVEPEDGGAHFNLAQIYRSHGMAPLKAAGHFRSYIAINPDADDVEEVRGWIEELERQGGGM